MWEVDKTWNNQEPLRLNLANKLNGKLLLAYIAGIIDGEGCIMIHSNLVRVAVKNTNEWLIKFLKMNFGGV